MPTILKAVPTILKIVACVCFVLATLKLVNMVNLLSAGEPGDDLIRHQARYAALIFGCGVWFWFRGTRKSKEIGSNPVMREHESRSER